MACCFDPVIDERDPVYSKITVEDIETRAQSGDLFYASGRGKWSDFIRLFSNSGVWSHVGIFIKDEQGQLYILDVDVSTGVKLLTFSEYLFKYNGYYFGMRNLKNISPGKRATITKKLFDFSRQIQDTKYTNPDILVKSLIRGNGHDKISQKKLYCAQLVVKAYRHIGLIRRARGVRSSNSQLIDFLSSNGTIKYYSGKAKFRSRIYYADIEKPLEQRNSGLPFI